MATYSCSVFMVSVGFFFEVTRIRCAVNHARHGPSILLHNAKLFVCPDESRRHSLRIAFLWLGREHDLHLRIRDAQLN